MIFDKDREIKIMGIVNLTDDSYFAQSRCQDLEAALERAGRLIDEGADIIDVGACSTRPGSQPVGEEVEWARLEPFLKEFVMAWPETRLSIDTYFSSVVRKSHDVCGSFIVNDISAGEDDPKMLQTVGDLGLEYVAMHKRGNSLTMQTMTDYEDVTAEVKDYFDRFAEKADAFRIKDWILDPGFGFAKTALQNYELIRNLPTLKSSGRPLLVGMSRKSMIYRYFDITPEESLPATQALHMQALINGADILRVHDVAEAKRTLAIYRMVQ